MKHLKLILFFLAIVGVMVGSYLAGTFMATNQSIGSSREPEVVFIEDGQEEVEPIVVLHDGLGRISWTLHTAAPEGVQVVWSRQPLPEYPPRTGDKSLRVEGAASASIDPFDGDGTYFVRVCIIDQGLCKAYSSELQATFGANTQPRDGVSVNPLDQPKLWLKLGEGTSVSWVVKGIAEQGVRLVWSLQSAPTYPEREGDQSRFYNVQTSSSGVFDAFAGDGIYFIRLCEVSGAGCRAYSNELTIQVGDVVAEDPSGTANEANSVPETQEPVETDGHTLESSETEQTSEMTPVE